jgi:hypothetical protein
MALDTIIVEIHRDSFIHLTGTSSKTGKPYEIKKQTGWLHVPNQPYPLKFEFEIAKDAHPYLEGRYTFTPQSFEISREGKLQFARVVTLQPVEPLPAAVANGSFGKGKASDSATLSA